MRPFVLTIAACLLALLIGLLLGRILNLTALPSHPTVLRHESGALVPVVDIRALENGALVGSVHGDVRLVVEDQLISIGSGGTFRAPITLPKTTVTGNVPSGMQFVASKRGKKYYPVGTPAAEKLAVANRIYFGSAEAAEVAGYSP